MLYLTRNLTAAECQARETPAQSKRCLRPRVAWTSPGLCIEDLPCHGVLATGELDEEAAIKQVGVRARLGVEITGRTICGPAPQRPQFLRDLDRENETRSLSDVPFPIGLHDEVPAVSAELEVVRRNATDSGATACLIETQLANPKQLCFDFRREDPEERPVGARLLDVNLKRRALERVRYACNVPPIRSR